MSILATFIYITKPPCRHGIVRMLRKAHQNLPSGPEKTFYSSSSIDFPGQNTPAQLVPAYHGWTYADRIHACDATSNGKFYQGFFKKSPPHAKFKTSHPADRSSLPGDCCMNSRIATVAYWPECKASSTTMPTLESGSAVAALSF